MNSNSINPVNAPVPEEAPLPPEVNNLPPQNALPLGPVEHFRVLNLDMELDLFARIRILENNLIDELPPQLNMGEYEALVRGILSETVSIQHYWETVHRELFEVQIMVLKANSLDQLHNLLMSETPARLTQICSESPFPERAIRREALEFINDELIRLNISDPATLFDRTVLEHTLNYWIQDLYRDGHRSPFYLRFISHFTGEL